MTLNKESALSNTVDTEDISIVMAVYNHEDTVAAALDSALSQEMPYSSKIYCLNDASTDGSAEILKQYELRYPERIQVFTSAENLGSGKACFYHHNPPVNGRYWCLLAGDDFWTSPDKLAKQIKFLDQHADYTGVSCDTVMKDEVNGTESFIRPARNEFNLLDLLLQRYPLYVHTTSIIWRNIHREKGFFLPPDFQKEFARGDVMIMHMMLGETGKLKNIPEVMSCYRVTGKGVWTSKSKEEQRKLNKKLEVVLLKIAPLKIKIYLLLQLLRFKFSPFRSLIPGPIND